MKNDDLLYFWELVVQDFLGCVTSKQLQAFKTANPHFSFEFPEAKKSSTLKSEVVLLIKYMKDNKLGYFGREHDSE